MLNFLDALSAVEVVKCVVEEIDIETFEKVDILISEPMGILLFNERMIETYIYARRHFLKKNGLMFPVSKVLLTTVIFSDREYKILPYIVYRIHL